ncbi:MAG: glycosyltransferase [Terriglobales bacterium]
MTTVAYIANQFPSAVEPYVIDEITELRRRGTVVVCCSGKRVSPSDLSLAERAFWKETRHFQPLSDDDLIRATRRLFGARHHLWRVLRPLLRDRKAGVGLRLRALGHTLMGAALAEELEPLQVEHIHAHHGYFASWMALTAAELLGIGFSFTLHGSDLLQRADLLPAKLAACRFCITVSDYNRQYILENYPSIPADKIMVQRLGVDQAVGAPGRGSVESRLGPRIGSRIGNRVESGTEPEVDSVRRRFCLLAVGRLHRVKDHRFLIEACSVLRRQGLDFICWIVGEGPERGALERQIDSLGLQEHVHLIGQVPRGDLPGYFRYADLVVMTSRSEGIPVVLMEAMAQERLVLAPAITGIPELVAHQSNGYLYEPGSLPDFVSAVRWIRANQAALGGVQRAAAASIAAGYNRQRNLRNFADQFLAAISHIAQSGDEYANPVLQQVRLSI